MFIKNVRMDGYRNYEDFQTNFSEGINVITGNNAQGKTNLLEALFFLASGKSFRSAREKELIHFDSGYASVFSEFFSGGREQNIEVRLYRDRKKEIAVNAVKIRKTAELAGRLRCVLFCPDDLSLIKDGASVRRRLMDACLCQLRPRYASELAEFGRLYEHKTRILRDRREKPSLLETLDDYNLRLAQKSAELIHFRAYFVKLLAEKAAAVHSEFTGGAEELSIRYKTVSTVADALKKPHELLPLLLEHQAAHKKAELESGLCLSGAHKDDLEIEINGETARSFASQGQARTAALSIKLSERDIHYDDGGEYPVLLLDDVLSELDAGRQNFVLNRIQGGQVFITCCGEDDIAERTGGRVIRICGGKAV